MPGAVFSRFAHRLREHRGPLFPLHVGDTWMEPPVGARMQDLSVESHPGMHRYSEPQGLPALVDAIVEKVRSRNGIPAERASVLVGAGATGVLGAAVGMLAEPGEEVLVLAPFWPLIKGIIQAFRATPVEVPFYDRVEDAQQAVEALKPFIGPRTVAVYVSSPSNPTGKVLSPEILAAVAELCRERDLWLISDEVYEDLIYEGRAFSPAQVAPERSFSAYSFSKAYGMAGNRVGYLVGPPALIPQCRKVSTHTFYAAPTAGQLGALAALRDGVPWLEQARASYREAGRAAAAALGLPAPQGSTFLWLDVASKLDDRGLFGFLEDCLDDGLVLAPGPSFGQGWGSWVRLCYTCSPPDVVAEGVARLARRIA